MLEKFLISIGLKQPESIPEPYTETTTTVRPSGENRFIDNDKNKSGIDSDLIFEYFEYSKDRINLPIGLMCIPNIQSDPNIVFSKMQKINTELKNIYSEYKGELSMGMSEDYEIALDYGATIVRVGSKIFK